MKVAKGQRAIFMQAGYVGLDQCRSCGSTGGILAQYIHEDGRRSLRWVCSCGDYSTTMGLPVALLQPWRVSVDELPVCKDNRAQRSTANVALNQSRCLVCRQPYADGHHWAPRSIFPHWPDNITAPLCPSHHLEWHQTMRQHGLRYPHELEAVA